MILRKYSDDPEGVRPLSDPSGRESGTSIRWRLSMITALIVAAAVGAMTLVTYWAVSGIFTSSVDTQLDREATAVVNRTENRGSIAGIREDIEQFQKFHPDTRISVQPGEDSLSYGDAIHYIPPEIMPGGQLATTVQTVGNERVLAKRYSDGTTIVLAQDMATTQNLIAALGSVLTIICLLGILLSIIAGAFVSTTGLRPLVRFQRAVDRITHTDELQPIAVRGSDELAQLSISFNAMVAALQESRRRQNSLIADAGHELKTPLTSIRTNIELLMMVLNSGDEIPEEERRDIKMDVIAQLDEMSDLINDLVDLARFDGETKINDTEVDLEVIVDAALRRIERRHPDLTFEVSSEQWPMIGDGSALERAVLNLIGNAGKWSPAGGTVRIKLHDGRLAISDSGRGIAEHEREKVFQRFYRADESRSMPGSGLGLAIVQQTVERHGGSVWVEESSDGGARLVATFPGLAGPNDAYRRPPPATPR